MNYIHTHIYVYVVLRIWVKMQFGACLPILRSINLRLTMPVEDTHHRPHYKWGFPHVFMQNRKAYWRAVKTSSCKSCGSPLVWRSLFWMCSSVALRVNKLHVFLSLFMFIKVYNPSNSASDHFSEKKIVCGIEYDAKTAAIKFYCDHTIPMKLEQRWPTPCLFSLSLNISCSGCWA